MTNTLLIAVPNNPSKYKAATQSDKEASDYGLLIHNPEILICYKRRARL